MRSGWVGTGPKVKRFEEMFKEFKNCRHAIAVSSCTAALHLSLLVLNIEPGDEVITTPLTFASTANSIVHVGAQPVFADVQLETMNIDPVEVKKKINKKTKAIIPVHFAGRPCEMDALMELANRSHLHVVEDAAHAIESSYKGKPVGTMGDLGCFSFYVTKNITTVEGGMVVTDRDELANPMKSLALHGLTQDAWQRFSDEGFKHYQVVCAGFKYNMTDIQASIGIHQLEKIEAKAQRRKEIWEIYINPFKNFLSSYLLPHPPIRDTPITSIPRFLTWSVSGALGMNFSKPCTKKTSERESTISHFIFIPFIKKPMDTERENFRMLNLSQIGPSPYLFQRNLQIKMSRM